jgi:ECF transporter S component (folate family)
MTKFTALFKSSLHEFRNIRCVTLTAMLGAISIIIGTYFTFMIGNSLKIGFSYLPNEFLFYMFGPAVGAIFGAAMDILTFILKPTGPYFYGFTLSAILKGLIYGLILYKKPLSLRRIFIANAISLIFITLLLDTYWLTLLYGKAFLIFLSERLVKIVLLPVETFLLYLLIKGVEASGVVRLFRSKNA